MSYEVFLSNRGNPDRGQDPDEPVYGTPYDHWVACDTIEDAQIAAEAYRDDHHLGGGNWGEASVRDLATGDIVGHISYNGRFWPEDGSDHLEAPSPRT